MSVILQGENPIPMIPKLAVMLGDVNKSLILQQVHYWCEKAQERGVNLRDGHFWTWKSYEKWKSTNFPWMSESSVKKAFLDLEKKGYLISAQYSKGTYLRTKWYRVDYDRLNADFAKFDFCPIDDTDFVQSIGQNMSDGTDQFCPIEQTENVQSIKETPKENPLRGSKARDTHNGTAAEPPVSVSMAIPYDDVIDLYNRVRKPESDATRIRERDALIRDMITSGYTMDKLEALFQTVADNHFLNGGGKGGWVAGFDWIMRPANAAKIMEGQYKNRQPRGGDSEWQTGNPFLEMLEERTAEGKSTMGMHGADRLMTMIRRGDFDDDGHSPFESNIIDVDPAQI